MIQKIRWIRLIGYITFFVLIYCIPLASIEGQRFCIWYHLFHIDCFGCGFTRAFFCLMHGQFLRAFAYHHLVIFVPIVFLVLFQDSLIIILKSKQLSLIEHFFKWGMTRCYPQKIKNG